jgi:hypothetical protein
MGILGAESQSGGGTANIKANRKPCAPGGRRNARSARGLVLDAEVDALDLRIVLERLGLALEHGAAGLEDVGVIRDLQRERHRLLRQQQREPLAVARPASGAWARS